MHPCALWLAALPALAAAPPPPAEGSPHYDLEQLYDQGQYAEGLTAAEARIAANPSDPAPYWHAARFIFELGETLDKRDKSVDMEAHYERMLEVTERGLAIAPADRHLQFAKGIAMGRIGTSRGVLSSLFMAQEVESLWLGVADSGLQYSSIGQQEVLPCDAYLTLGIFYRLVPESRIVQAIAGTRGDLQKSVDYQRRASECAPNRASTMKEYGVSLLCYGQKRKDDAAIREGLGVLSRTMALPVEDPTDRIDVRHAATLIGNPSLACGYSRDGQQDLDEKKLGAGAGAVP